MMNEEKDKDKKLEEEIESLIDNTQPDTKSEYIKRPTRNRQIRDIAHYNDSFYKFLSKQLLIIIATRLFKDDPKEFIKSIVKHFMEGYKRIIFRKYELREGTSYRMGDTEENQMLFNKLAEIEKKNEFEDLERYGEIMKKQILDLVDIDNLDDLDNYNFDPDVDDDIRT